MDKDLKDLLTGVSVGTKDLKETVTFYTYNPTIEWHVAKCNLPFLLDEYCKLVQQKLEDGAEGDLTLSEAQRLQAPLTIDFELSYAPCEDEFLPYDQRFPLYVCGLLQEIIRDNFIIKSHEDLCCLFSESMNSWEQSDETIHHNLRFYFPNIVVQNRDHEDIRQQLIKLLNSKNITKNFDKPLSTSWDKIVIKKNASPVPLYGSVGERSIPPLVLKDMWNQVDLEVVEDEERNIDDSYERVYLNGMFDPHNHAFFRDGIIPKDELVIEDTGDEDDYEEQLRKWLPLLYSFGYNESLTKKKDKKKGKIQATPVYTGVSNAPLIDIARILLGMINPDYVLSYIKWFEIGKALYSASQGTDAGLVMWRKFTTDAIKDKEFEKLPRHLTIKNVEETCNALYNSFPDDDKITIKTLAWYAKSCNPNAYAEWHKAWCSDSYEKALSTYDTDIAIALYRTFWLEYVYVSEAKTPVWYRYTGHRWVECKQGLELSKKISDSFCQRFEIIKADLIVQASRSMDQEFKRKVEAKSKLYDQIIKTLKNGPSKSSIMREAREHFEHPKFLEYLDSEPHITGVLNGVLEVDPEENIIRFRSGKPEDYISMTAGVKYSTVYSDTHPLVIECSDWIKRVFPNMDLYCHFMKFAASMLYGKNADKIFPIWSGGGDNSKSMVVKLFECVLGEYCIKLPVNMLADQKRSASGPTPELARADHKRCGFLEEPSSDLVMANGIIKRLTGGDSFFARKLNENGKDIEMTLKVVLMCNKVPTIVDPDQATKNRVKIFPFMSKWCDDAPEDPNEQMKQGRFKKDPNFERNIPRLAPAFLWLMVKSWRSYKIEGLKNPPVIIEQTEDYFKRTDIYAQFLSESITNVKNQKGEIDEKAKLSIQEIYNEFKIWYRSAFPDGKIPSRTDVRSDLISRWGPTTNNCWLGIKLLSNDTDPNHKNVVALVPAGNGPITKRVAQ